MVTVVFGPCRVVVSIGKRYVLAPGNFVCHQLLLVDVCVFKVAIVINQIIQEICSGVEKARRSYVSVFLLGVRAKDGTRLEA